MSAPKIIIQASIHAPIARVWDCYTSPEHITHWNFASDDWCCPSASNDLRIGGVFQARMEAKDGSFGFDFKTTYTQLEMGQSFTYDMEDGREVNVQMTGDSDTTLVVVQFDPENENPIELQQQGWQAILNNFRKYTEAAG